MKSPLQCATQTTLAILAMLTLTVGTTYGQQNVARPDAPLPHLVRMKLRPGQSLSSDAIRSLLGRYFPSQNISSISPWIRPELTSPPPEPVLHRPLLESTELFAPQNHRLDGLRHIVVVEFANNYDIEMLADKIDELPEIEYAEPIWPKHLAILPNDLLLTEQLYLEQLHVEKAWDHARANATVTIAVIDSGIDPAHPDLRQAIWKNQGETGIDKSGKDRSTNKIDDDGNGFVDDWWGYDFAGLDGTSQDNVPTATFSHGVHVAGIAAATGNNGEGVAGVGFGANIMALKVTADTAIHDPDLVHPYEAILYAGRMGAQIINCSWGGLGKSPAEQEVIDAVTEMGSLIVASAGNQGRGVASYPAAYRNVISVGSVNAEDQRSGFSNYHESVDIVAPGENVLSTIPVDMGSYGRLSGTSMAAPMVSGAAALILSQFGINTLTPEQLGAILKGTADDIDAMNPQFRSLLGAGRLNVERSIEIGPNIVYAEVVNYKTIDGPSDGYLDAGEEFDLSVTLHNILAPSEELEVDVRIGRPDIVQLLDSTTLFHTLTTGEQIDNQSNPFHLMIREGIPYDQIVPIELIVRDGARTVSVNRIELVINPSYATTRTDRLSVTFSGDGRIGFVDFPTNSYGDGFQVDGSGTLLAEGGLIVGTDAEHLLSVARNDVSGATKRGLQTVVPFRVQKYPSGNLEVGSASLNDAHLSPADRIGVDISLETQAYSTPTRDREVLLLYTIRNTSANVLDDFHCALFLDWDLGLRGKENRTVLDPYNRLGYTAHVNDPRQPLVGGMLVSDQQMNFTALDSQLPPLANGFQVDEKWRAISGGIGITTSEIGDNAMIVGAGPIHLAPGDSTVVAFALMTGNTTDDLQEGAESMRLLYRELGGTPGGPVEVIQETAFRSLQPNPFRDAMVIQYNIPDLEEVELNIYDLSGRLVATLVNQIQRQGIYSVPFTPPPSSGTSVWVARLRVGGLIYAEKLMYLGE